MSTFDHLHYLQDRLREAIRGQDHVVSAVVERVIIGETGLATPGRPKGSFFFVGPTGVGKTELARVLSRHLYRDKEPLRFDMAEFAADDAIKNFIGDQSGAAIPKASCFSTRSKKPTPMSSMFSFPFSTPDG
jgi:ATP-dependent Clp protease ATP-binding subunit ClpA